MERGTHRQRRQRSIAEMSTRVRLLRAVVESVTWDPGMQCYVRGHDTYLLWITKHSGNTASDRRAMCVSHCPLTLTYLEVDHDQCRAADGEGVWVRHRVRQHGHRGLGRSHLRRSAGWAHRWSGVDQKSAQSYPTALPKAARGQQAPPTSSGAAPLPLAWPFATAPSAALASASAASIFLTGGVTADTKAATSATAPNTPPCSGRCNMTRGLGMHAGATIAWLQGASVYTRARLVGGLLATRTCFLTISSAAAWFLGSVAPVASLSSRHS